MEDRLLNVKEAADILNIKPSTLYEKVRRRMIPFIELWSGKRKTSIRFSKDDLEGYIKSRTVKPKRNEG